MRRTLALWDRVRAHPAGGKILPLMGAVILFLFPLALLLRVAYQERALLLSYPWLFRVEYIVAAVLLYFVALLLAAAVWADMMRTLGSAIGFADHMRYYCLSQLARRLPGTIWYVVGRGYLYRQRRESVRLVSMASGLELVVTTLAGILAGAALGATWIVSLSPVYFYLLLVLLPLCMLLIHPRTIRWLFVKAKLADVPHLRLAVVGRWLVGFGLIWLLGGVAFYCTANIVLALSLDRLAFFAAVWCLVGVSSILVFFLPTNLGFNELGISLLLATTLPVSLALAIAVLSRIAFLIYEIAGIGLFLLGHQQFQRRFGKKNTAGQLPSP